MTLEMVSLVVTLVVGFVSVFISAFAIWLGMSSRRDSKANFDGTKDLMHSYDTRNREVLAEIDKKAAVTERTVTESHQKLLETVTSLLSKTVVADKGNPEQQLIMQQLLQAALADPALMKEFLEMAKSQNENK